LYRFVNVRFFWLARRPDPPAPLVPRFLWGAFAGYQDWTSTSKQSLPCLAPARAIRNGWYAAGTGEPLH
jgi:hypothetical protein